MPEINRSTTQALDGQVIAGIEKNLQNVASVPLAGSTYTMTALTQLVQSRIDAINNIATAKATWLHAAATYVALDARVTQVVRGLRQHVLSAYGEASPILADFGFTAPRRRPLTPEQQVAKTALARATRKVRGTLGRKQRAAIK